MVIHEASFGCLDILILGKSPKNKWRQCLDTNIVIVKDVKHQSKPTKCQLILLADKISEKLTLFDEKLRHLRRQCDVNTDRKQNGKTFKLYLHFSI